MSSEMIHEVFVLGNQNGGIPKSVIPDGGVFGMTHTDVLHVLRMMTFFPQSHSQSGRQLSIDQKSHKIRLL